MAPAQPPLHATLLFEVAIYGPDLAALADFYTRVLGLEVITRFGDRGFALRCGRTALLVFDPARTREDDESVPKHGATGAGHVAFLATAADLPRWREHLAACGVHIEREVTWPAGGTSLYVRDPADNSVELAPPTLWGGLGFEGVAGPSAARERLAAVVRSFVDAINRQDWDALSEVVAPTFVRHSAAAGEPGVRSRGDLVRFLQQEFAAFPDGRETIDDLVVEGDRVAARHTFTGTQLGPLGPYPPTRRSMRAQYLAIYRIEGPWIAEAWAEWDTRAGLAQLGHLKR
jgi:predicted ester cyclase/catechol 2,3-dioxygenase-like lactoylglutathione lyase family enzyme